MGRKEAIHISDIMVHYDTIINNVVEETVSELASIKMDSKDVVNLSGSMEVCGTVSNFHDFNNNEYKLRPAGDTLVEEAWQQVIGDDVLLQLDDASTEVKLAEQLLLVWEDDFIKTELSKISDDTYICPVLKCAFQTSFYETLQAHLRRFHELNH